MTPANINDEKAGHATPGSEPDALDWLTAHWDTEDLGDPAGILAVASVLRLRELLLANLEETVAPLGLSGTDYLVLLTVLLGQDGRRPLGRIARAMMVHPTTITQVVDRLESQKLLVRVPHPSDRRTTLASLTPRGRTTCAAATAALRESGFGMPGIPAADLEDLVRRITPLRRAAGDDRRAGQDGGEGGTHGAVPAETTAGTARPGHEPRTPGGPRTKRRAARGG
jgi:DNA-binding MarR family transcriptional regulator